MQQISSQMSNELFRGFLFTINLGTYLSKPNLTNSNKLIKELY